jgi:hypothetical protein
LNYLGEESEDTIKAAFGPNYERLMAVKKKYDPLSAFAPQLRAIGIFLEKLQLTPGAAVAEAEATPSSPPPSPGSPAKKGISLQR